MTNKKRTSFITAVCIAACIILGFTFFLAYANRRLNHPKIETITQAEMDMARSVYLRENSRTLQPFSDAPELCIPEAVSNWESTPSRKAVSADLNARSAILVNADTGEILLEKNADEQIPPASLTKIVSMYTVFHAIAKGKISFDDRVNLPPESWAENIPPGSSLMLLHKGQKVTVRELLLGMSIVSGNDAAIALADYVTGSVSQFAELMNNEMTQLGLQHTRFVEPSGLSEHNITTAREFADFSLVYIRDYPDALQTFHSKAYLDYPMPWNVPDGKTAETIRRYATNQLPKLLPGCDGLKTGYIDESGYNLSVTAKRNDTRFIAVTMGGTGTSYYEGKKLRNRDGISLMEWAFSNFETVKPTKIQTAPIPVWGGIQEGCRAIPAGRTAFTRYITEKTENAVDADIAEKTEIPGSLKAPVAAGDIIGWINYYQGAVKIHSVALIADRSISSGNIIRRVTDTIAAGISSLF